MTESMADVETALEQVVAAARAHLAAVRAADAEPDDNAVWAAYVALNNASQAYDDLLNDCYGEVTPWDLETISAQHPHGRFGIVTVDETRDGLTPPDDPHPVVLSVRQRRDYRVPSVSALLRLAEEGRASVAEGQSIATVAEAVLELLQSGDGTLGMLDVKELDPLDGVVVVAEVRRALGDDAQADIDPAAAFGLADGDVVSARLDERSLAEIDD